MRPLHLKIEGLHSFREAQEIDFTTLCDTGVFGIFGPTGSGKSTILDAITLALYGKVERAAKNTQGIINHDAERVLVEYSFQLGNPPERRTYRVERLYRRSGENNVNARNCRLVLNTPDGEEVLADKERDVTKRIEEILGLTVEDFTRAVVLPQNKFSEFLSLRDSDRRKMLERLFNLEVYGNRLAAKIKERLAQLERVLSRILGEQAGLGDASPESIASARAAFKAASLRVKAAGAAKEKVLREFERQNKVWELQGERTRALKLLENHLGGSAENALRETRLEAARRAEPIRPILAALESEEAALREARLNLESAERQLTAITGEELAAKKSCELTLEKRHSEEPRLFQQKTRLEGALAQEAELAAQEEALQQLTACLEPKRPAAEAARVKRNQAADRLAKIKSELERLKTLAADSEIAPEYRIQVGAAVEAARDYRQTAAQAGEAAAETVRRTAEVHNRAAALERCTGQAEKARKQGAKIEEQMKAAESKPPATEDDILRLQKGLERGRSQVAEFTRCSREAEDAVQAEKAAADRSAEAERTAVLTAAALAKTRQDLAAAQARRDTLDRHNLAVLLASGLASGQPCPVCGSTEHPQRAVAASEPTVNSMSGTEVQEALDTAAKAFQEAQEADAQAGAAQVAARLSLEQSRKLALGAGERLAAARSALPEKLQASGLKELQETLQAWEKRLERDLSLRQSWTGEVEKLRQNLNRARESEKQAEIALSEARTILEGERKTLAEAADRQQNLEKAAAAKQAALETLAEGLGVKPAAVEGLAEQIARNDQQTANNKKAGEVLERDQSDTTSALDIISSQAKELELELADLETTYRMKVQETDKLRNQLKAVTGGHPAGEALEKVSVELAELTKKEEEARQTWEAARIARENAEKVRAAAARENQVVEEKTLLTQKKLSQALEKARFVTPGEVESALLTEAERADLEGTVQQFRDRETLLRADWKRLDESLAGQTLTAEQWADRQAQKAAAETEFAEAATAAGVAEATLKTAVDREARWRELEDERNIQAALKGRLEELQRLFRGNAFVEFVAQEQVVNVALAASERLKQMTRHRYALEVDSEGGFVMRDDANGGVKRPVSTLSGGETFLTALALALALSSQIQLKGEYPLEFFFLDEGFGTLDAELLDTVMTILEELPADRMTIGVISHVPEMRHRMARRLVVEPAKPGTGSRVKFEVM